MSTKRSLGRNRSTSLSTVAPEKKIYFTTLQRLSGFNCRCCFVRQNQRKQGIQDLFLQHQHGRHLPPLLRIPVASQYAQVQGRPPLRVHPPHARGVRVVHGDGSPVAFLTAYFADKRGRASSGHLLYSATPPPSTLSYAPLLLNLIDSIDSFDSSFTETTEGEGRKIYFGRIYYNFSTQ